jgi:hypothetical protein
MGQDIVGKWLNIGEVQDGMIAIPEVRPISFASVFRQVSPCGHCRRTSLGVCSMFTECCRQIRGQDLRRGS